MFELALKVLEAGLSLWNHGLKNKYVDRLVSLRRSYREATSKPPAEWDDAVIDGLEFELRLLADSFSAQARGQDAPDKP
jgi:hypothetical protein